MFLQAGTEGYDAAFRIYDFDAVYLVAGCPVFDGSVAAGIGSDIAADEARVPTAGIAGIKEILLFGGILKVRCAYARFDDGIEAFGIDFKDFIHLF